ncbi:MAG: GNAT family N-acetyltransferase [Deltaproteobacteria bacterium]|nr:GNAT family N-acetyltransferase [Deltaproteobacteria bacterium]MBW2256238.1 GNAT family N-acetyltransferase [Deltaproteobacteria bacterium]
MEPTIRAVERRDLKRAVEMWAALMENGETHDPRWKLADGARDSMRRWAEELWLVYEPFPHAWVADVDGGLVGWLDGHPSNPSPVLDLPLGATIGNLWVEPAWRRRGVGRRLVETFIAHATAAGCTDIEVGTLTRDTGAVAFWRDLGFGDWLLVLRRGIPLPE